MPQYDNTHSVNRQNGTQCQGYGTGAVIAVDSGNAGGWTPTTISCANWTNGTTHEEVNRVDHIIGDTGCGGNGCANYKYMWIDGINNPMNGNYGGTQGFNSESGETAWGWQFQPDMNEATGTALTGGWTVISATVALGYGNETAPVTASYTISPIGTATPIIEPNNYVVGNYALAAPSPVLAFGKQGTNTSSAAIPISISNPSNSNYCTYFGIGCGSGTATVTSMAISGTNASDFTLAGSCTTIASGSDCEPTITFKPTAAANTNETASLTVNLAGATTSSLTMILTGTSATVTTLSTSSCPTALSANTNYQLSASISCAGTAFTFAGTGTDVNLDGYTVTYGNTSSASQVNAFASNGFNTQITIHNGVINSGAGTNTFGEGHPESSVIGYTGTYNLSPTLTSSFFNLTFNSGIQYANAIENNNGLIVVHDNKFNMTAVGNCATVGCRDELQAAAIYEANVASIASGATEYYNNTQVGGPQGGFDAGAPGTVVSYNSLNPGNATGTNTNNFSIVCWSPNCTVYKNSIQYPLTNISGSRGIIISAAGGATTNAEVYDNIVQGFQFNNNTEYSGCPLGGTYGLQYDDNPVGPNTSYDNLVEVYALNCAASALRVTESDYTTNVSYDQTYIASRQSGAVACTWATWSDTPPGCAVASAWDGPTGYTSTNDIYTGDSSDVFVSTDAPSNITIQSPVFNVGSNPSNFHTMVAQNGPTADAGTMTNFRIIDATFNTGTSPTDAYIFSTVSNPSNVGPASFFIDWTQTMQVNKASGPAVSGAVVTWTDTLSNTYTCTTNSSGACSVVLTQYRDNNDTGTGSGNVAAVENRNPYSLSIPLSGCTTYSASGVTISATGSWPITLSGC
jgi:hypothetical protein